MLELKNIIKDYFNNQWILMQRALAWVSLKIKDGDFISIVWPSWSWKSTLMNIIWLLDMPTLGDYILDWEKLENLTENKKAHIRWRKIWFVFQSYNLIPRVSVLDQVTLPLSYLWISRQERENRAIEALKRVNIVEKINSKPNELSWWQQQRVAIARAIVTNPTLILADEPTWALDTKTWREVLDIFAGLNKEGKTVVLITHDVNIAWFARHTIHIKDWLVEKIKQN